MSPTTNALIDYWHRLPAESRAIRRLNLAALCDEVRAGRRPPEVLVTVAIGDTDADIVHDATLAFLEGCASGPTGPRAAAIGAALEWVSRGLALNRGAVFAVLLGSGDAGVLGRLAPQRLTLSEEEIATLCAAIADCSGTIDCLVPAGVERTGRGVCRSVPDPASGADRRGARPL